MRINNILKFMAVFIGTGLLGTPIIGWNWNQSFAQTRIFHSYIKPLPAPDFSLENLQGKIVDMREHRGRIILLNFWATW